VYEESALKSYFNEIGSRVWLESYGLDGEFCEYGNEPSGSINSSEFLEKLSKYKFMKGGGRSAP
jgi:hypothetical protein